MQSVTQPRKASEVDVANGAVGAKAAPSRSPVCVCVRRLDDLAVDSDEEVDYSKMDQVTTRLCCPNARRSALWSQQAALLPSCHSHSELPVCFRGIRRVLWAAGTSTLRRSIQIT